jgi:hypothetical protein
MKLKNSFLNLFRLYSECTINADAMYLQMMAMQEDLQKTVMFKFGSSNTILWTIEEIQSTLYGHHKGNKNLLNECIDSVLSGETELIILT